MDRRPPRSFTCLEAVTIAEIPLESQKLKPERSNRTSAHLRLLPRDTLPAGRRRQVELAEQLHDGGSLTWVIRC